MSLWDQINPAALISVLDYGAVLIFALTGALVASRAQLDLVGFVFMAALTAVGGGTLRDLIIGRETVFWVAQPPMCCWPRRRRWSFSGPRI